MVVINRKVRSALMPAVAIASLMVLNGCEEDEVTPKFSDDLLIGDWQVTEIDGETSDAYFGPDYTVQFNFKSAGNLDFCFETEYNGYTISYCDDSYGWAWQDASNTRLVITETGGTQVYESVADVVQLNDTNMELEFEDGSDLEGNIKFIKVN